jgi:hypothetical protein
LSAARRGAAIAAGLALVILAGAGAALLRLRPAAPLPPAAGAAPPPRARAAAQRSAGEPRVDSPGPPAPTGGPAPEDGVSVPGSGEEATGNHPGFLPALERADWEEIAAALLAGPDAKRPPRALVALAFDLAGTVPTTTGSEAGELTHPAVLSRILEELLARSGGRFTPAQKERVAALAAASAAEIDRLVEEAPSRPRLANALAEAELKLELVDGLRAVLDAPQGQMLDRLAGDGPERAPLSPLALIEARPMDAPDGPRAFAERFAAEICREFEVDPAETAAVVAALETGLAPLFAGSAAELGAAECALLAARVQSGVIEDLLRRPGLSPAARRRGLAIRLAILPRAPARSD